MRRLSMIASLAVLVASAASSAAKAAPRYQGAAMGNSTSGTAIPKHHFVVGDSYALRFRDLEGEHTRYRVCLAKDDVNTFCAKGQTGTLKPAGWSQHVLYATAPGEARSYTYKWYVGGVVVARWRVSIGAGD